ncbi:hypothetical protein SK128_000744 [Halocaridina rubra]|uniref:RUN domain-containing protein n=1 Tax=Halocaridina rubra TaxID=373956 RepID=A0AAN8WMR2_HALRR
MAATKRPAGINFDKILQSLKDDIHEMRHEYEDSSLPINDDNKHLHQFCDRMEFILKFGIKGWHFMNSLIDPPVNFRFFQLKTSIGRSRYFIRYCLVHQCLADIVQQCVDNASITNQFFQPESLLLSSKLTSNLLEGLYQLCDVPFDLPSTVHDLDVSWPTYARQGSAIWHPPSRTVSLSSLSSYTSQMVQSELADVQYSAGRLGI